MAEFRVGVKGELAAEQVESLRKAGIAPYDIGPTTYAGFGGNLDPMLTYVKVTAEDESEARGQVARVLGVRPDDLLAQQRPD